MTQVLSDGTITYTYGLGRISQTNTNTEYFLGDALGSVRQLTNTAGEVTFAKSYDPYGAVTLASSGTDQAAVQERPTDRDESDGGAQIPLEMIKSLAIISVVAVGYLKTAKYFGRKKTPAQAAHNHS